MSLYLGTERPEYFFSKDFVYVIDGEITKNSKPHIHFGKLVIKAFRHH
jgi:hypothetical protein